MEEISNDFHIEVLYGGKAIFVKCHGYASEIFIPLVQNNRIVLKNAIQQIRCDQSSNGGAQQIVKEQTKRKLSAALQPPLANSTPAKGDQFVKENQNKPRNFASPYIVRRALVEHNNAKVSVPCLAPGLKIVRLHRVASPLTPKRLGRLEQRSRTISLIRVPTEKNSTNELRNLSHASSFNSPPSLSISRNITTPNQSFIMHRRVTPVSETKWRKCITPQRTYIRRNEKKNSPHKLTNRALQPLQLGKNGKLIPDFRLNPTKWPSGEKRVMVKPRKLVVDEKLMISPKSFKNQLNITDDLYRSSFQMPSSKKQFKYSQLTAFDILTNSSFYPRLAKHINALFRRGCINKTADTILKYQQLTLSIPEVKSS